MRSHFRWGALVRASIAAPAFAAGCASAPPSVPDSPPAPASSPSAEAPPPEAEPPAPAGPRARVSEPSWLLGDGGRPATATSVRVDAVRYGRGLFAHHALERSDRGRRICPVARPAGGGCGVYSISTTGRSPDDGSWVGGSTAGMPPLGESKAAPRAWISFAPARDGIYAQREGSVALDRIDEKGSVSEGVVEASSAAGWWLVRVAEMGEGTAALLVRRPGSPPDRFDADLDSPPAPGHPAAATQGRPGELGAAVIEPGKDGEPPRLGAVVPLGIGVVNGYKAKAARSLMQQGMKALWGAFAVAPAADSPGTWALVWHEVSPPARGAPRGAPKPSKTRAKHGCGGPPSRPLTDASVEKRLHITRLRGASVERDDVVEDALKLQRAPLLDVRPTGEGLEVNGALYDAGGHKTRTLAAPVRVEPEVRELKVNVQDDERIVGGAFDAASGEGIVMVTRSDALTARRFDASGAAKGPPLPLPGEQRRSSWGVMVARLGGEWVAFRDDRGLGFVTGPLSGARPVAVQGSVRSLFPDGTGRLLAVIQGDRGLRIGAFAQTPTGLGPEQVIVGTDGDVISGPHAWLMPHGERPATLVDVNHHRSLAATAGASWAPLEGAMREGIGSWTGSSLHPVAGDLALLARGTSGAAVTWLASGKTTLVEGEAAGRWPTEAWDAPLRGPLIGDSMVVPDEPGPPLNVPSLEPVARRCPLAWPTGPRRMVLACEEPRSPDVAGLRATLRGVTVEPG